MNRGDSELGLGRAVAFEAQSRLDGTMDLLPFEAFGGEPPRPFDLRISADWATFQPGVSTPSRSAAPFIKSALDRGAAAGVLLLLVPLLLVIALAVRLTSSGPAIYRQTRVGRGGRTFGFVKFRTMVDGAEHLLIDLQDQNECDAVLFKIREDPRTTPVGRWLRRFSLDELPQLWNVLLGDMSLVGPRPALPTEVATYCSRAGKRLEVKPGLTGLWQVSGRSDLCWDDSVDLDLHYVDNWSLGMDLRILAKTVPAVVSGRGAY